MTLSNLVFPSKYFNVADVTRSQEAARAGILNDPPPELYENIYYTAAQLDLLREFLQRPVIISSWYRCVQLNRLLCSKDTSAHIQGLAADVESPMFGTPVQICRYILANKCPVQYDQMILEHTWIHFGFKSPNNPDAKPRFQVLTLLANGGYAPGLTDKLGKALS